jgi:hypothetical protein
MREFWHDFWDWYEQHYRLNVTVAAGLFAVQLIHLVWLFGEVVWARATGVPLFEFEGIWKWTIVLVDYTEIPAILSVSLVYINDLRRGLRVRPLVFLLLLNSQWLHLFWITGEFVVSAFAGEGIGIPGWLAWVAILIDYAEVPVIIDTLRKMVAALREGRLEEFAREELRGSDSPAS